MSWWNNASSTHKPNLPKQPMWDGTEIRRPERSDRVGPKGESSATSSEDYYKTVVMPMLLEKEREVLAEQPKLFEDAVQRHGDDVAGSDFSCIRHGDFLSVFMTRAIPKDNPYLKDTKSVQTINLRDVKTIFLKPGSAPSLEGTVRYVLVNRSEKKDSSLTFTFPAPRNILPPPKGYTQTVQVDHYSCEYPWSTRFYHISDKNDSRYDNVNRALPGSPLPYQTQGIARAAVDDTIIFSGLGLTLYIPFGKGAEVERKILEALTLGYTPSPLPTISAKDD